VTLSDLARRSGCLDWVTLPNSVTLTADYIKVVDETSYILRVKCSVKNVVSGNISFMAIFTGDHSQRGRSPPPLAKISAVISDNLETVQDIR